MTKMMDSRSLVPVPAAAAAHTPSWRADLADHARAWAKRSRAKRTVRAYETDRRFFEQWCAASGLRALPVAPQTVALALVDEAPRRRVSTLRRRLSAIRQPHRAVHSPFDAGHDAPRALRSGTRHPHGVAATQKAPALTPMLRTMSHALPATLLGTRDRALLVLGFASAFRRGELVALDAEDIELTSDGMVVTVQRSKADQEGEGHAIGAPYGSNLATCPVRTVLAWREAARFAGHSLHACLATNAATTGIAERVIMKQTGHRRPDTLRRYIPGGSLFREHAAAGIGL